MIGTKSTISASRLKSVGKNLFDEEKILISHVKNSDGYYAQDSNVPYGKKIWENVENYKGQLVVEIKAKSVSEVIYKIYRWNNSLC